MKKYLKSFIHNPLFVTILAIIIAIGIGNYEYKQINKTSSYSFVKATSGSILSSVTKTGDSDHVSLGFTSGGKVTSVLVKVGDTVKKGQTLATLDSQSVTGSITQAKASYALAEANYQKVLNGATVSTVDVANSSVTTNTQNLTHLLQNTYTQVDTIIRTDVDGLYNLPDSDTPEFGISFFDPATSSNVVLAPTDSSAKLDLRFQRVDINKLIANWQTDQSENTILKNLQSVKVYLANISTALNSISTDSNYQTHVDKAKSGISSGRLSIDSMITNIQSAQQSIDNAKTSVTSVASPARPEDIAAAKAQVESSLGNVQIAQSNLDTKVITSPGDGVVTSVKISAGEIAGANATVIEVTGKDFSKDVAIMIPKTTVRVDGDHSYVLVKTTDGVKEKEITLGASDNQNVEVISGLSLGDEIAIQ
jgi:multidrug efflux pump subunit AcrA (membrane-fusion protein)